MHQFNVGGAGAEKTRAAVLQDLPQRIGAWPGGMAVVKHRAYTAEQGTEQGVPHHPAGGGENEGGVTRTKIQVQMQCFELLQQNPAMAVNDGFGHPVVPDENSTHNG